MHSTNGNSENSEIGVISEFSECTVGRPLTHRKLNQRFGWKAPWFILRTAGRCSEAPPFGSQISAVLSTPRISEKASMFGMFAILPDTAYP